jgi:murein L,D-transpeptidase YafK
LVDSEGIFRFVMKLTSNRRTVGLSVGRLAALVLGISAPLAFWSVSTLMSSGSAVADANHFSSNSIVASEGTPRRSTSWQDLPSVTDKQGAEGRLLEIYRLIGQGEHKQALMNAKSLTEDVPNFQLAQLVYGDLLLAQTSPIAQLGAVPQTLANSSATRLAQLRQEADRRLAALQERPPSDAIPSQFIDLPNSTKHAIAVDASRSRLYLFENGPQGLRLVSDHYASIGKLGAEKNTQGDQRTPIGVYYITSRLEASQLTPFYGAGALPLNYPNEYDRKLGRTGNGIWLHGVPSESYARSPLSTDGCVAMANPELQRIMAQVQPRSTPVVIAHRLEWKSPTDLSTEKQAFRTLLEQWRQAKSSGKIGQLMTYYSPSFASGKKDLTQWRQSLTESQTGKSKNEVEIKDLAILGWRDKTDLLVVTFGELDAGQRTGTVKRQYWAKENGQWKIFFEGVIG